MAKTVIESNILGIVFGLSLESHLRLIAASAYSKLGIMRKTACLIEVPVIVSVLFCRLLSQNVKNISRPVLLLAVALFFC